MKSLSHHVITCHSDICNNECIHISVSKLVIEEFDTRHEISPGIDFQGS